MTLEAPAAGQGTPQELAAGAQPAAAPPNPDNIPWLPGADPVTAGYVKNKGWAEPAQMLTSYQNLEKLLGADKAGNAVILPKPDAPQTEIDAFYSRLGRPSDPTGYKIEVPKEGGSPEFAKAAAETLFKLGVTKDQGEKLVAWYNEQAQAAKEAQAAAQLQAFDADNAALKLEWGNAHTQNVAKAQAAARGLGLDDAAIDNLQKAMGHAGAMRFLAKIGDKVVEPGFVAGQGKEPFGAALTPGQAQARILELKADKDFVAKYVKGDAGAKAEMERLHKFAYPDEA